MAAKILVVDDDETLLNLINSALQSKGHEVSSFKTGHEALQYLENEANVNATNLLILDRMLPDTDGVEVLQKINEKNPGKIPVLILSSLSSQQDILEGLSKGAVDYLTKPFNIDVLLQKVDKMIQ